MERSAHPALFIKLPKHTNRRSNHIPWSISQFERLLRFLLENEGIYHCTGYLLVGTYAGLRTEEFNKIYYGRDGIDLDSGEIYISDEIGKTRRTRCFEMRPELLVALKRLREWNRSWYKNLPAKAGRPYTNDGKLVREKDIVAMRTKLHLPEEKGGAGLPVFHRGGEPRITPALP